MADPTQVALRLQMRDFGSLLVTRDQGEPVRAKLLSLLERGQIEIDLDGVEAYTPSFMDEVLGKCLETVGVERFRRDVHLVCASVGVRKLVNLVLSNRAAHKVS